MKEKLLLIFFIALFILIRSIHFSEYLNFSHDQGLFSIKSLEIYQQKTVTLIGPSISFNFNGREIFQGSITYYFQLLFLILGGFNPITSSYLFMLFTAVMVIPLYNGVKMLINKRGAFLLIGIYSLLPFYIDYTRFFWNPNFQFALLPLLLLLMGLYKKHQHSIYLFFVFVTAGMLTQFHYQFVLVDTGLLIYYFLFLKSEKFKIFSTFGGLIIGLLPFIIFESRNNFYNTQTLILFLNNFSQVVQWGNSNTSVSPHYLLTLSFLLLLIQVNKFKEKISNRFVGLILGALLTVSLFVYLPSPSNAFGMVSNWNYLQEEKVYNIIREENLKDYNFVNLIYDTTASVQKYLHKKDNVFIDYNNYQTNKYLFVITGENNYMNNSAYEVNMFKPSRLIKRWSINNFYTLYLLQRDS